MWMQCSWGHVTGAVNAWLGGSNDFPEEQIHKVNGCVVNTHSVLSGRNRSSLKESKSQQHDQIFSSLSFLRNIETSKQNCLPPALVLPLLQRWERPLLLSSTGSWLTPGEGLVPASRRLRQHIRVPHTPNLSIVFPCL